MCKSNERLLYSRTIFKLDLILISWKGNKKNIVVLFASTCLYYLTAEQAVHMPSEWHQAFCLKSSQAMPIFCMFIILIMDEYLLLFWICSPLISIYVPLVLSSCAGLKIAAHVDIICSI